MAPQIADRLNDLGYAERAKAEKPGEFARLDNLLTLLPRGGDQPGRTIRITFKPLGPRDPGPIGPDGKPVPTTVIQKIDLVGARPIDAVRLELPLMTSLVTADREKRRRVSLSLIPRMMVQAVLAIEDRRFYEHPGIDPIRIVGAIITNVRPGS